MKNSTEFLNPTYTQNSREGQQQQNQVLTQCIKLVHIGNVKQYLPELKWNGSMCKYTDLKQEQRN